MRRPVKKLKVHSLYEFSKKRKILEKLKRPVIIPKRKILRTLKLSPTNGAFNAPVTYAYLPKIRRRKEPLSPGKIMAVIPIIPQMKINHKESGVETGIRDTMRWPTKLPKQIKSRVLTEDIFSKFFPTMSIEATINPKKSPQV